MMKRMWIAISILTFALMLSLSMACADTLILPEDTVEIGDDAFYGTSATTIILPEHVTTISDRAFGNSNTLCTVYVPDVLMSREAAALQGQR